MKTCLVTGSSGLIGQHLVPILDEEYNLHLLVRSNTFCKSNISVIQSDLSHDDFVKHLPSSVDSIIHLAQSENFRNFPEKSEDIFNVNTVSCLKLLEYARKTGVRKFIYASSGIVYGKGDQPFKEEDPLVLNNRELGFYYTSKISAEAICESYSNFMDIIILRFFFVYGPGQKKQMLIPRLVQSVIDEKPILLHGPSGIKINPVYVHDAVKAIKIAIELKGSHKINIGGAEIFSLREIGNKISETLGIRPVFEEICTSDKSNCIGDIQKMSRLLAKPMIVFDNGIRKYVDFIGNNVKNLI